jgi:hypothetical protein
MTLAMSIVVVLEHRVGWVQRGHTPGESLMTTTSSDVALPVGGVLLELHLCRALVSG